MSHIVMENWPSGRRSLPRHPTSAPGSVVTIDGSRSIVVEDVSEKGARICGHHLPPIGRQVLIRADGLELFGSVVWAVFRERGIRFD